MTTEEKKLPEGLEEAATEFANQDCVTFISRKKGFIAGAEWQKEQDLAEMAQSKSPLLVAYANRCFENGKQVMKEEMMEKAVEGFVGVHLRDKRADVTVNTGYLPKEMGIKADSKVKVIIVKEDKK